jgi:quinol monooxygenase YgiN
MKNIVIVAHIKVKEAFKDEVYSELIKLHDATNKLDKGCIQYELHKNLEDENCFTFIETWENKDFLSLHEQKEHFVAFVANIENKIENLSIKRVEKL